MPNTAIAGSLWIVNFPIEKAIPMNGAPCRINTSRQRMLQSNAHVVFKPLISIPLRLVCIPSMMYCPTLPLCGGRVYMANCAFYI